MRARTAADTAHGLCTTERAPLPRAVLCRAELCRHNTCRALLFRIAQETTARRQQPERVSHTSGFKSGVGVGLGLGVMLRMQSGRTVFEGRRCRHP